MSIEAWKRFYRMSLDTTFLTCFFSREKKEARCSKLKERYCLAARNRNETIAAFLKAKSSVSCRLPFSNSGMRVMALIL